MALLDSPDIRKIEARYVSLFGRTLIKGMKGVPASAYKSKVKMQFGTATFRVQLDQIINDFYKTAIGYIDNEIDKQFSGQGIRYVRRRPGRSPITAASEPLPLTVELVKQSTELSEVAVSSIIEMMKEDGIYELHPNTLAKRLTEFFDGEKHRAVRFSRTVSADIANNSTLHRYRQRKIGRWQFHAKLDDRTTDQCRLLHGTIFETDDPSSDQYRPPLHHHCVTAGTKIKTPTGEKNIEDIQFWDMVVTHENNFMPVTETMSRFAVDVIEISTANRSIEITTNHPILTKRNEEFVWVEAGELKEGDEIVVM